MRFCNIYRSWKFFHCTSPNPDEFGGEMPFFLFTDFSLLSTLIYLPTQHIARYLEPASLVE